MNATENYQLGLLYLVHLLVSADGHVDENEKKALLHIKAHEQIPDTVFDAFQAEVDSKKEKEIYQKGIELINQCSDQDKLRVFVHLYRMSEVDGRVHVREVRLLLYSIKMAGIEFNDVVEAARKP